MFKNLDQKRLLELATSNYQELRDAYCALHEVKKVVDTMHVHLVAEGKAPDIVVVEGLHLMVDELFGGLERYLMPECDPESAVEPVEEAAEEWTRCRI